MTAGSRAWVARGLGILKNSRSCLFLCDMQEKFRPTVQHFDAIVSNSARVLRAAQLMGVPAFATEQYPKGLGRTVEGLGLAEAGITPFEKTCFSMVAVPELMAKARASVPEGETLTSVILCGIETHACIFHTTLELMEQGIDVHVVADCCSSRSPVDRKLALERLRGSGAFLTTSESVILSMAPDAAHPKFKQLQKLVIHSAADTGLLD